MKAATHEHAAPRRALGLVVVLVLLAMPEVRAHGFLTTPKVTFLPKTDDITAYSATIDGAVALPAPPGMTFLHGPSVSQKTFKAAIANSSYPTLRAFVMKHQALVNKDHGSRDCGFTSMDLATPQPLPKRIVWEHGENEGFTPSHEGPCEIWCDDERVFHDDNCAKTYPEVPAVLPYDRAKCEGKKRLQAVWLALHEGLRWQVYLNCAPLASTGGPPSTSPNASTPPRPSNASASRTPLASNSSPNMNHSTPTALDVGGDASTATPIPSTTRRPWSAPPQKPFPWPFPMVTLANNALSENPVTTTRPPWFRPPQSSQPWSFAALPSTSDAGSTEDVIAHVHTRGLRESASRGDDDVASSSSSSSFDGDDDDDPLRGLATRSVQMANRNEALKMMEAMLARTGHHIRQPAPAQ